MKKPPPHYRHLMQAVRRNDIAAVWKILHEHGAQSFRGAVIRDGYGKTPVHVAMERGDRLMLETLLSAGLVINVADKKGRLPLDVAARGCPPVVLRHMRRHGAITAMEQQEDSDLDESGMPRWMSRPYARHGRGAMAEVRESFRENARRKALQRDKIRYPSRAVEIRTRLTDIFDPAVWAGRPQEMTMLWHAVPADIKKYFNFSAVLSRVRRESLQAGQPRPRIFPQGKA